MPYSIQFCGAARTVTGSKHLLEVDGKKILVDCGIFQGERALRERNWEALPFEPHELSAVVITHAHMDHIGYLPRLCALGYRGPIYATPATIALSRVSLPDSGRLQEEEAAYLNRKGLSRHSPALPLYTEQQAYACMKQFEPIHHYDFKELPGGVTLRYMPAGHILGSAFAELYFPNGERILMGGDLGRYDSPIINDPHHVDFAEYLVIESTYGDRLHPDENTEERLAEIFDLAFANQSAVLVPSFAIGRTQELLYHIHNLQQKKRVPRIPIFVDSPMATSASRLYLECKEEHDKEMRLSMEDGDNPMEPDYLEYIRDRNHSKALNARPGPMIIIAGSGMANGGRIVHHLANRLSDPSTIVVFTGYQAEGTMGRELLEGAESVRLLGHNIPVRATITKLNALSAHADQGEIMRWLGGFKSAPRQTFIVHGEPHAQDALKAKIEAELGWRVAIPEHLDRFEL
jgi:metallo-beta-lactamase family protein